jgi:2-polyprenyl-3-methyl-5-hydroxy-6-metoxy-1,4-benzoquinol methylase
MEVQKALEARLRAHYENYYRDTLALPDWRERVEWRLRGEVFEEENLNQLQALIGPIKMKRLLNVGCGTGGFNMVAHRRGANPYGVDINPEAISIARLKARLNGMDPERFVIAQAEALPFRDNCFDIVYCFSVLEHVEDPSQALKEMVRVLARKGSLYISVPNAWGLYEGHYKVFWIPFVPRPLGKLYLRLRRRPVQFLDHLNRITPRRLTQWAQRPDVHIRFLNAPPIPPADASFRQRLIHLYHRIFGVSPTLKLLITKAGASVIDEKLVDRS